MVEQPPEKSLELTDRLIGGGLSSIPLIGGVAGVAYQHVMEGPYNKRLVAWRQQMTQVVNDLEGRFENLADDEVFLDAFINATRAAQATHQQEKLDALRNAVVNSVAPGAPDIDEQARFFRLVDQFSAAHLNLLSFLHDPDAFFERASRPRPSADMGSLGQLLEDAIPAFARRREWYDLLMTDLVNARLVLGDVNSLHGTMTGAGLLQSRSSGLGKRFLDFISNPDISAVAGGEGIGS